MLLTFRTPRTLSRPFRGREMLHKDLGVKLIDKMMQVLSDIAIVEAPMKSMGIIDYDLYKKTYHISEKFNDDMVQIGSLWIKEVAKP